jgi:hypothetical protein
VTLRPWREADVEPFRAACQDGSVPQWTGFPYEMTTAEAATLVRERMKAAQNGSGASFAIVDGDDSLLGSAGLLSIDWSRSLGVVAYWLAPRINVLPNFCSIKGRVATTPFGPHVGSGTSTSSPPNTGVTRPS